ncbi:hypothetical protein SAMN02927937_01265 [Paenimyroides aquimaris]|uniref:Preprotein translocase subunit SecB n=1 Tax=Paenimyroides marinum TaxID=1159016 RepID=A0A1H6KK53_9FLAO|nr:hypothetical protein [Paenimyroides aquimaris]SEH76057.1 hypothetical protein SAMN02927937_01265 [Paenimyroides aquimaris]
MNDQPVNINFRLINITTEDFKLNEVEQENGTLDLNFDFQFGVNNEKRFVKTIAKFKFLLDKVDVMEIAVSCEFEFEPAGWQFFVKGEQLVLPKGLLQELAMFTMNTTRGVLHNKTEGHKLNKMFIPMIGGEFIKQDLAIPLNPTTVN